MKLSAASKRAQGYPKDNGEWFCGFSYTKLKGIGYEEGIHRRDPSSIIRVNNLYYVWYTKSIGSHFGINVSNPDVKLFPWDYADIFYATSKNGIEWEERGCAIHRGEKGEYDERTVCTPDIMEHDGIYYLVYQATSKAEQYTGINEKIAIAIADNPDGPWRKLKENILCPMSSGRWFEGTAKNNFNDDYFEGSVHDPSLQYFNGMYYLYYKCGGSHNKLKMSGYDTRWGVAISENSTGPYVHSEYNPITNSGHETLLWTYKGGIVALINRDGPEKNTIQYSEDGVNFKIMSYVENTPQAGGAYRTKHNDENPLEGIRWGLCHVDERGSQWCYIERFDIDRRVNPYLFSFGYPQNNCQHLR